MNTKYIVNKYAGRTFCGNAFYNTLEECMAFANDGFCTWAAIVEVATGEKIKIKFEGKIRFED